MAPDPRNQDVALTLDRLAAVLDRHGTDKSEWPQAEREALARLVEQSPHAQALFAVAEKLGRVLDALESPTPSATLVDDLLGRFPPPRTTQAKIAFRQNRGWDHWPRPVQVSLAAALAVGVTAVLAVTLIGIDAERAVDSNSARASFIEHSSNEDDRLDVALDGSTFEVSDDPADDDDTVALIEVSLIEVSLVLRDEFENLDELNQLPLD